MPQIELDDFNIDYLQQLLRWHIYGSLERAEKALKDKVLDDVGHFINETYLAFDLHVELAFAAEQSLSEPLPIPTPSAPTASQSSEAPRA